MATIILRNTKGSPLTSTEMDNNFNNLNIDISNAVSSAGLATAVSKIPVNSGVNADSLTFGTSTIKPQTSNTASSIVVRDSNNAIAVGAGTFNGGLTTTGKVGIGVTNPNVSLELRNDTNTAGNEPIILLNNRGAGATTNTNSYYVGGIFGSAYRDVKDPAYIAGIDFYRDSLVNGLASNGSMRFYVSGGGGTLAELRAGGGDEKVRIDSGGNLLVGATSPNFSVANRTEIQVKGSTSSYFTLTSSSTFNAYYGGDNTGTTLATVTSIPLVFATNSTERARIDKDGNVGIGTLATGISAKLDVAGTSGTLLRVGTSTGNGTTNFWPLMVGDGNGTGGGTNQNFVRLGRFADGTAGIDAFQGGIGGSDLAFGAYGTIRMRLNKDGDLDVTGSITSGGLVANIANGDIGASRSSTTGALYLGTDGATSLARDGTTTTLKQNLSVTGVISSTNLNLADSGINGTNLKLTGNGSTTPNKHIRTVNGQLQVVNSAYSATILTLDDSGNLTIPGNLDATGTINGRVPGWTYWIDTTSGSRTTIGAFVKNANVQGHVVSYGDLPYFQYTATWSFMYQMKVYSPTSQTVTQIVGNIDDALYAYISGGTGSSTVSPSGTNMGVGTVLTWNLTTGVNLLTLIQNNSGGSGAYGSVFGEFLLRFPTLKYVAP